MPYTPPAQRSPVASQSSTPPRKLSISNGCSTQTQLEDASSHGSRPNPPQSSGSKTYLHKHRRSPSINKSTASFAASAAPDINGLKKADSCLDREWPSSSSPSRETPDHSKPTLSVSGADSPTGSFQSTISSDDETQATRGRPREVGNLAELQAAISSIEQHREGSPMPAEDKKKPQGVLALPPPADFDGPEAQISPKLPLSAGARKISHSRSSTDTSAYFDFPKTKFDSPARSSSEDSLDEDEDDLEFKPSLIRKKSGELVRPALRGSSSTRKRPSSMPGTPTYSKAVHFQESSLEHVRHFLQVDRPIAVSAGSSPVESHDEESEFPFGNEAPSSITPPYEWEIRLTNFPRDTIERQTWPVRTEKVYLSADTRTLMGNVAVRNLSFHKVVIARFTLDYWKTTSEVVAEYNNDVRKRQTADGCDRFTFNIKLEDLANLENRTMFFCVRYNVGGQEYWDNNSSTNYQIDFTKRFKPQKGKHGATPNAARPLNALPRSKPSQPRPRSVPSFDDFGSHMAPFDFSSFPQPTSMVGESPIRFRNRPSQKEPLDASDKPKSNSSQQAFGNRYDFGASLSAAIQAASVSMPKVSTPQSETPPVLKPTTEKTVKKQDAAPVDSHPAKPAALTSDKPGLASSSYHELLDKYCFVRSKPISERKGNTEQVR